MKLVMLSKALVVGAYQKKLEALARLPDVDLVALVPPSWREPRVGTLHLERRFTQGYRLETLPMVFNGQHHLHFYPSLAKVLAREKPDLLHIDEESFNLATFLAMRSGKTHGIHSCFFNWANIERNYPPPFCWFEKYNFRHAAYAIAGNQEAATILRRRGYQGSLAVLPQFGVDPDLFPFKGEGERRKQEKFVVGYVGRLVKEKGVLDLLEAVAGLPAKVHLRLVGEGELQPLLLQRSQELGLQERVTLLPPVESTKVAAMLHELDTLVLPSHTTANWKEQFGRILIEAMSCGVPVIGSSSGEIPNVISDAGLIFPERKPKELQNILLCLLNQPELSEELSQRGRTRVLKHYTQAALAKSYYDLYQEMLVKA